jgi:hypothetical protein
MTTITGDAASDQLVVSVGKQLIKDVIKAAWSKVASFEEIGCAENMGEGAALPSVGGIFTCARW